jgi:hypothetical protein
LDFAESERYARRMRSAAWIVLVAACTSHSASVPDGGQTVTTGEFTVLGCTSGNPGDPTCPINHVDLDLGAQGPANSELDFVAQLLAQNVYITDAQAIDGSNQHIRNLRLEQPCGTDVSANAWGSVAVDPGATVQLPSLAVLTTNLCVSFELVP